MWLQFGGGGSALVRTEPSRKESEVIKTDRPVAMIVLCSRPFYPSLEFIVPPFPPRNLRVGLQHRFICIAPYGQSLVFVLSRTKSMRQRAASHVFSGLPAALELVDLVEAAIYLSVIFAMKRAIRLPLPVRINMYSCP